MNIDHAPMLCDDQIHTPSAISLATTASDVRSVSINLPAHRTWLAPLLESVNTQAIEASPVKVGAMVTIWGGVAGQEDQPEHAPYVAHMCRVVSEQLPWLLPLLDAACALIAVSPGSFTFMVRSRMGETFDVPELVPFTHLLPWATAEDLERMN